MDDITSFVDNSHSVDIIIIYFKKAFDTISHNKVQAYDICGKVKLWIKEFLFNRSFKLLLTIHHLKNII